MRGEGVIRFGRELGVLRRVDYGSSIEREGDVFVWGGGCCLKKSEKRLVGMGTVNHGRG